MDQLDPSGHSDQIARAFRLLQSVRDELAGTPEFPPVPWPGSMMLEEHSITYVEPIDGQVARLRGTALAQLREAIRLVPHSRSGAWGSTYALYGQIRASLEALGLAFWLVQPSQRHERVLRSLRLAYQNANSGRTLWSYAFDAQVVEAEQARTAQRVAALNTCKDRLGVLRQHVLKVPPSMSTILTAIPPTDDIKLSSPFGVWKMCSSFLHGSPSMVKSLTTPREHADPRLAWHPDHFDPCAEMLTMSILACTHLLGLIDRQVLIWARCDSAGRPVIPIASGADFFG